MYLITTTKLDLTFSVDNCVRFMNNFSSKHFEAIEPIWQYVRTIKNKKLKYRTSDIELNLIEYVDFD